MTTSDARAYPDQRRIVSTAFAHAAFDGAKRESAPFLLLTVDPLRVEWANAAAIALFNADPSRIALALSKPGNDMETWAADVLRRLPQGAPRLEKRRIGHRLSSQMMTLLCGRADSADGRPALAVAILGLRGDPAHGPWHDPVMAQEAVAVSSPEAAVAAAPQRENLRFVWKTDALGQIVQFDVGPLAAAEASVLPILGHRFADTVQGFDAPGAGQLARLLAPSLHPIEVGLAWPVSGDRATVPVILKATPWFDASRAFAGFRGFGLVDLTRPEAMATAATGEPDRLQAEGSLAASDAEAQVHQISASVEAPQARPANVVQFRPAASMRSMAGAEGTIEEPTAQDDCSPPARDDDPGPAVADPTVASDDDAVLGLPTETSHLSSSEQEAFQEIGRTLQSGSLDTVTDEDGHDIVGVAGLSGLAAEVQRNAAALVDATTAGLLILRGPQLLFVNQAVLDLLRYPTQADAEIGLGAALAQSASQLTDGADHTIDLPGQDGELVRVGVRTGPVEWSGSSARLWTLRQADHSGADQSRPGLEQPDPPATPKEIRGILNAAGEPIALLDVSGRIMTLNLPAERWFGQRSGGQAVGQDIGLLLTPESRPALMAALGALATGAGESLTLELTTAVEDPRSLDMRLTRISSQRIAASWREHTTARRGLDLAKASPDQPAGRPPELLAKLSHQIRTPLNAIIGFTEVMMDERFGPLGNPRYKDYLKDVHASGAHVMSLVNDLLDLSRIEAGGHDLDLAAVDINRIIAEGVAQVQAEAHRARVIVRTAFSPRQPMIMADDSAARQIVANLLSNAIKFNEPGGQVIVSTTTSESGTVMVRIRDTGIGMSDRDIEAALEPFRQLEPSRQAEATGLGLPLTKALVGANGASLSIRSRPGEGTMVEVTFQPAAAPARVPA